MCGKAVKLEWFEVSIACFFLLGFPDAETSCREGCCPIAVLPSLRDPPPHGHGGPCAGVGGGARRSEGGGGGGCRGKVGTKCDACLVVFSVPIL